MTFQRLSPFFVQRGKGHTAFESAAPNGAAPEKRTSRDDMSYLSTTDMVSSTARYFVIKLTGMSRQQN